MTTEKIAEPSCELLSGDTPWYKARRYFLATRPKFLTASILAVLFGTSLGWKISGNLNLAPALIALFCIACIHAAANVLNDVYDDLNGTDGCNDDRIYPYTGGSRFIQNGILSRSEMQRWGILLLGISILIGLLLLTIKGPLILIFGLAGLLLGILYSAPPVHLASRGLGEFAVAAAFGLIPITGAAWLQAGIIDGTILALSIPISCWVTNILLINEVPDATADRRAGKKTLVVRLGLRNTRRLYHGLNSLAPISIVIAIAWHALSPWALLLPFILFIIGFGNANTIDENVTHAGELRVSIARTLATHAIGCIWLTGIIWL